MTDKEHDKACADTDSAAVGALVCDGVTSMAVLARAVRIARRHAWWRRLQPTGPDLGYDYAWLCERAHDAARRHRLIERLTRSIDD